MTSPSSFSKHKHMSPTKVRQVLEKMHIKKDKQDLKRMHSNKNEKLLRIPIFDGNHSHKDANSANFYTDCASKGSSKNINFPGVKPTLERKRTSLASPPNLITSDKASMHDPIRLSQNSQSKSRSNSRSSNVSRSKAARLDAQTYTEDFARVSQNSS